MRTNVKSKKHYHLHEYTQYFKPAALPKRGIKNECWYFGSKPFIAGKIVKS